MKTFLNKTLFVVLTASLLLGGAGLAVGQNFGDSRPVSNPFEMQYFTNRYMGNPSFAGIDSTLDIHMAYRKQFIGMPGAPVTQALTADFNPGRRVGLGIAAVNDEAGLIKRTRFGLTYAYHLPVGRFGQQLHFGISAAFAHASLDPKGIIGDQTDPAIAAFNGRKNTFEVDYGMAYTDGGISLQASLKNLVGYFKDVDKDFANVSTFYAAAAYKFGLEGALNSVEPQLSLRGVKGYNSIVDVGANLIMFQHILNIFGLYHSSNYFSVGVGINYKDLIHVQGVYISKTKGLKDYTDGNYELDLSLSLFKNR